MSRSPALSRENNLLVKTRAVSPSRSLIDLVRVRVRVVKTGVASRYRVVNHLENVSLSSQGFIHLLWIDADALVS